MGLYEKRGNKYVKTVGGGGTGGAGGTGGTVELDTTLKKAGMAADAKAVGDKFLEAKAPVGRMQMQLGESPVLYGSNGTVTRDTAAFQAALAENRRVQVPGGEYHINGELVVRDNCELVLSHNTVLVFENTAGNCITLNRSASLRGNHATIKVPYAFTGNVINVDTSVHTAVDDVPPFIKWDPQWKTGRYLTDLNIVKPTKDGNNYSAEGNANGTAVYIKADGYATSTFIWGLHFSGLRIAGAFTYGVRAVTILKPKEDGKGYHGYNNDMRIEAYIDACDIGVSLEDCSNAFVSAIVQPRKAANSTEDHPVVYARHGIQLIRSRNTDLSGSRVWDWNATNTLWTPDNTYQHIAMIGNCSGTILNDFLYYEMPSYDIRDLIYTDTPSNLEKINILQEPFTRWFKPVDRKPYFSNGETEKELLLKEDFDTAFQVDEVKDFTDVLATATDGEGNVFNGIGYLRNGGYWATDGKTLTPSTSHGSTGYIPCQTGDIVNIHGMSFANGNDRCRAILFDENFNYLVHINQGNLLANGHYFGYAETADGCQITIKAPSGVAYMKLSVFSSEIGANPMIAVNEDIRFAYRGYMADGILVKSKNVEGLDDKIRAIVAEMIGT